MDEYQAIYEDRFVQNLARYSNLRQRIQRRVEQILGDTYNRTERLGRVSGELDLRGCRSARVSRNFRIIFVIGEECRHIKACQYCFCEGRKDETVVFFNRWTTQSGLYNEMITFSRSKVNWVEVRHSTYFCLRNLLQRTVLQAAAEFSSWEALQVLPA